MAAGGFELRTATNSAMPNIHDEESCPAGNSLQDAANSLLGLINSLLGPN